jgi:membrane dipeptidase
VRACNELGIVVDVSHLNERGFWDVARTSTTPIVATHSNAHAITPSSRNLTDKQLDAIRDSGGLVGVNFSVAFSRPDGRSPGTGSGTWDMDTPMSVVVRHFQYLAERMGVDHVGFGSDFDGTVVPGEIRDAAGLPKLVAALRDAGFGTDDLEKVTHKNWLRVLQANWKS